MFHTQDLSLINIVQKVPEIFSGTFLLDKFNIAILNKSYAAYLKDKFSIRSHLYRSKTMVWIHDSVIDNAITNITAAYYNTMPTILT